MAFDSGAGIPDTVNFIGVDFTPMTLDGALDAVAARASLDAPFVYVATPNVDHVVSLAREPARAALYDHAWLTLNDSRVLAGLARRAKLTLPVAAGSDLTDALFNQVIDRHEPITIIGGAAEVIAELKRLYRLTDVRWFDAPMGLRKNPKAVVEAAAFAAEQGARFTFICVGAPQQEMIAYAIAQRGDATGVGLCVGASLDFLAGKTQRAPKLMRGLGLEWLHRLASEPQRLWKRYLIDGPRVFSLFADWRASMAAASAA